jgi:hypothetical protein
MGLAFKAQLALVFLVNFLYFLGWCIMIHRSSRGVQDIKLLPKFRIQRQAGTKLDP